MKPEPIACEILNEFEPIWKLSGVEYGQLAQRIARALLDAHQRGRREGMEEAAEICNERGIQEQDGFGLGREAQNYYRARDAIRAKAQDTERGKE